MAEALTALAPDPCLRDIAQEMSQENSALVRTLYATGFDLWGVDNESVDRVFHDFLDERFEFHWPSTYPNGGQVFRGREGVRRWLAAMRNVWSAWRFEPERFLEAGDRVVAFVHLRARGSGDGTSIDARPAHVWTIREGRAVSCEVFADRAEALDAAGLPA